MAQRRQPRQEGFIPSSPGGSEEGVYQRAYKLHSELRNRDRYNAVARTKRLPQLEEPSTLSLPKGGKGGVYATSASTLDPRAMPGRVEADGSQYGHERWQFDTRRELQRGSPIPSRGLGNVPPQDDRILPSSRPPRSLLSPRFTKERDQSRLEALRGRLTAAAGTDELTRSGCALHPRQVDTVVGTWSNRMDAIVKDQCNSQSVLDPGLAQEGRCVWNDNYKYCDYEKNAEIEAREAIEAQKRAQERARQKANDSSMQDFAQRLRDHAEALRAEKKKEEPQGWLSWMLGRGGKRRYTRRRSSRGKRPTAKLKSRRQRGRRSRRGRQSRRGRRS